MMTLLLMLALVVGFCCLLVPELSYAVVGLLRAALAVAGVLAGAVALLPVVQMIG